MKKLVVLSGAGISAESGIRTFRDAGGLWHDHDIMEVASFQGWLKNPTLVLDFYNQRRKNAREANPNSAHTALLDLEAHFETIIVTQNVDDLHERAGSSNILHLHGELLKSQSSIDPDLTYSVEGDIVPGDKCELGSQLRPNVVWFGEAVPAMEKAVQIVNQADLLLVIGTSLAVYPAASLIHYCPSYCRKFLVDPNAHEIEQINDIEILSENAGTGVPKLVKRLIVEENNSGS